MSRTYLFVRLWVGYAANFDTRQYDDVGDEELCDVMSSRTGEWVAAHPDKIPKDRALTGPEVGELAGWIIPTKTPDSRHGTAPMWEVFHVEDDESSAKEIIESLRSYERHFQFGPVSFHLFPASAFSQPDALQLERQLEWLEAEPELAGWGSIRNSKGFEEPRHLLRQEGMARSALRRKLIAKQKGPPQEVDLALRARIARLNDTQREVLRALLLAVRAGKGLTLDQLVTTTKANNKSTIERGIAGLEKMGIEIPNEANGAGYVLSDAALHLAQELVRIDAEQARKRR